jgi:hypothetical protein
VYEYIRKFNYLAQYGTHHVDTDEKKANLFRRGPSLPLQDRLVQFHDLSFNTVVSAAIAQDGTYRALLAEKEEKRKRHLSEPSEDSTMGAPPMYRLVYTPSANSRCYHRSLSRLSSIMCYPRHLSNLLSLYYLMHLSRRLQ